jgi:hypothetical protein
MSYKFHEEQFRNTPPPPPIAGELALVTLPVQVVMEWSDKILVDEDYDDDGNPIPGSQQYRSGFVMNVLPNQKVVFKDQKRVIIGQTMPEK